VTADEAWLTRYTEVRFKNYGLDAIEVQDNGAGIAPDDYETIALKHYTSKLSTYDDLNSLKTFGFRGEALSSLCALSKFHIVTARAEDGPKGTKLDFEQSGKLSGTSMVAAKRGTTVVIETLFHNLPVRRKELEKNVKREYSKVLALLNAYACISVGVKFSVSNSMPKGKKTIAFATNANSSTRGNISNVYGAKTVGALIPLDLEFQMDPSNRLGATQSAKAPGAVDDSGSRSVRIVGHISRPVVGEGRQTPDRQMFFVNSRPCNLPQVAKAFNEAYKAYNITQSPFIFADIQLDTEAYDVNVSPDKRTIMLHDQTTLLESLKESLATLFAGHDQTVPQSKLLGKEPPQPRLKPPTMHSRGSTSSVIAEGPDESVEASESRAPQRKDADPSAHLTDGSHPGFVKASLIERFAGRDTEDRGASRPSRRRRMSSPDEEISLEERPPLSKRRSQIVSPGTNHDKSPSRQRSQSPLFEPEGSTSPVETCLEEPSRIVQDFNARIASQHAKQVERDRSPRLPGSHKNTSDDDDDGDDSITTVGQTPQKNSFQSTIQNVFDRMRPMRTPIQQATITVGDTTTVSTIGSGSQSRSARQSRIHTPKFSSSGKPLNQTPKPLLFMKSLKGFAAPGTQVEGSHEEDDQVQDSSLPTVGPSPSLPRGGHYRVFEQPQIDDLEESPSTALPHLPRIEHGGRDSDQNESDAGEDTEMVDDEYIDESEKKAKEEEKIARMIARAEEATTRPTAANLKRASKLFKATHNKHSTIHLERFIGTDAHSVSQLLQSVHTPWEESTTRSNMAVDTADTAQLNKQDPEERLSLTVTKPDFQAMRIIGQFNLGFIIVVRPPTATSLTSDLFIVDQHASDEKYNFERLSATTVLVSQRLVHPHFLELTAVEEETILANEHALTANGFVVEVGASDDEETGRRSKVTSLPMSKEITFTPTDLEELLVLIMDNPPSSSVTTSPHIPRPSKVKKLLASRACRSSVMIGKTLQTTQMENIVRHMGSMDKPWSCPHGRPTMRHLYGLESWNSWSEGDGVVGVDVQGGDADWASFLRKNRS
jgi:DNA mismatch repair protein PMS2